MGWDLSGHFLAICSCDIACPCIIWSGTVDPTDGKCDAFLGFHVEHGTLDGEDVSGLSGVVAFHTEGPMVQQHGRRGIIVDAKAQGRQRDVLRQFFLGEVGGPPSVFAWAMPELLGVEFANIDYAIDGDTHTVTIDGFGGGSCTGIHGPTGVLHLTNTFQPANAELSMAKADQGARFDGFGLTFDNSGQTGAYAPFHWVQD